MSMLPKAEIHAFTLSGALAEALAEAGSDWRLQRCLLDVQTGGVNAALARYSKDVSPQLVVIEIEAADEAEALATVGQLADFCCSDTRAIFIGACNDIRLYRALLSMGVSDYLIPPVTASDLIESFSKALATEKAAQKHQLISVIGCKGGVGATSMAQALSWLIAEEAEDQVLLLDLCGCTGTAGIAFGTEGRQGLEELLADLSRVDVELLRRRALQATERLAVIAGGKGLQAPDSFNFEAVDALLDKCLAIWPHVIVDLPTGWSSLSRMVARRSHKRVVVTTPSLGSLRGCKMILEDLTHAKTKQIEADVIVNRIGAAQKHEVPLAEITRSLGVEAAGTVTEQPEIFAAAEISGEGFRPDKTTLEALEPLLREALLLSGEAPAKIEARASGKGGGKGVKSGWLHRKRETG